MSTGKEQLDVEDDFTTAETDDAEPVVEVANRQPAGGAPTAKAIGRLRF
jgi:hypothetical protein